MYFVPNMKMWMIKIKPHEQVSIKNVKKLREDIKEHGIKRPVVIDDITHMVLDGHHRIAATIMANRLNKTIPAVMINYFDENLILEWRDKKYEGQSKLDVLHQALNRKLYPVKTTRFLYRVIDNDTGVERLVPIGELFKIENGEVVLDENFV
jgi:hypothetical protein